MDKQQFISKIEEIVEVPAGSLTPGARLDAIETWDSLAVISFIAMADEHMGIIVAGEKLTAAKTVDDLCALVGLA